MHGEFFLSGEAFSIAATNAAMQYTPAYGRNEPEMLYSEHKKASKSSQSASLEEWGIEGKSRAFAWKGRKPCAI
jgi:hypothetical protein